MRIGVLGTGTVGRALGTALVDLGHDVVLGARSADNDAARAWVEGNAGSPAAAGTFADAAAHGELLVNATNGQASTAALGSVPSAHLDGKVLLDVANPLDFSAGFPPTLSIAGTDSLAETIQRGFPGLRVVKGLNTVTAAVMVEPDAIPGEHVLFVAGDDDHAKQQAVQVIASFGWPRERIIDLGDLRAARGMEMYLPLWLSLMQRLGHPTFNVAVQVG